VTEPAVNKVEEKRELEAPKFDFFDDKDTSPV
jgi:hypothetical protein